MTDGKRLRVAIAGAGGRMGQTLIEATLQSRDLVLGAALDVADSPMIGRDPAERMGQSSGIEVASDPDAALRDVDVLIDFTRPEGTLAHVEACVRHGVGVVIGNQNDRAAWGRRWIVRHKTGTSRSLSGQGRSQ